MELSNWAPEHSDALRELIAKGMSFSEAARAINSRFNTSYSRSAALGRARRLGLGPDDRQTAVDADQACGAARNCGAQSQSFQDACTSLADASLQRGRAGQAALRWHRTEASLPDRVGARRLPLSLWRRRRGRGHHLLRSSAPRGFELLQPAFSFEPQSGRAARMREYRFAAAGEGGMKKTAVSCVADRLKRLPRGHRIAHLRALIGLQPEGCGRRDELSELLREEIADASIE